MIINAIIFAVSICFISWLVAIFVNNLMIRVSWYHNLANLNFIKSESLNHYLGVHAVKWLIKNSFFRYFNPALKVPNRHVDLIALRYQMTLAEISHLIGFVFVFPFSLYIGLSQNLWSGLIIMFFNILMNLHPSLIQQENKRRLDRLIQRTTRNPD